MSKMQAAFGNALQKTGTTQSGSNLAVSCEWVAAEFQVVREVIPGPAMSDEATQVFLGRLLALARQVGPEKFHAVVMQVIDTCERRPTIALYRKMCGVHAGDLPHPAAEAWAFVSKVVSQHLDVDEQGKAFVARRTRMEDGQAYLVVPPPIPDEIKRVVIMMGGWTSLKDSYQGFWGMRWAQFKEFYQPAAGAGLAVTSKP